MDFFILVSLAVSLLALYIFYRYIYAPYQILKWSGIKGPTPIPFFGNYFQIQKQGLLAFEKAVYTKYGKISGYYIGKQAFILVVDPDIIKDITVKKFEFFTNRIKLPNKCANKTTPSGLLRSRDQDWKNKRKIITPTFTTFKMKQMVPLIEDSVKTLVEIMGGNVDTGKSLDFFRTYGSFTMETILATAFGRVIAVQKGEANSLTKAASAMFKSIGNRLLLILFNSHFNWLDSTIAYFIKPSIPFELLYSSTISLINARREEGSKHRDLLQLIMDEKLEEAEDSTCPMERSSLKLTDDDIGNLSIGFLLAGYETTANTLTFTSYLLALHPHIQEKLQKEIDSYYEDNPEATSYEASSDIGYLDMVIMESLRLYPVASQTARSCSKTTTIQGVLIPKDTIVVIPMHLLHKDTRFWRNPDEFDPTRFTAEEKAKRPQLCHLPFGFGPRNCVGMRFALLEAKIALIELLKRFTFIEAPDTEVPLKTTFGITLSPTNGAYLKVAKRND